MNWDREFGLSPDARSAISKELKSTALSSQRFQFDATEFGSLIAFKSIELDNGGTLTAPSQSFDTVFERQPLSGVQGRLRFTTEGTIVNEQLKPKS